jgi:hypothetical protein
VNTILVLVLDS